MSRGLHRSVGLTTGCQVGDRTWIPFLDNPTPLKTMQFLFLEYDSLSFSLFNFFEHASKRKINSHGDVSQVLVDCSG